MSNKLLRANEVISLTGLSSSTISRLEKQGKFPKRRKISIRIVAWSEIEIIDWIDIQLNNLPVGSNQ